MPRGRKRNQRKTSNTPLSPTARKGSESAASKAYTAGRTVKYGYRIHGPIAPVVTTPLE
jgi:hypothetical protein